MTIQKFTDQGTLPGRNEAEYAARSHWSKGSKLKREYTDDVHWQLKIQHIKPVQGKAVLTITFYEKDNRRDADNIYGGLKYLLDGMVQAGIVKDDTRQYVEPIIKPIEIDKINPRVEVIIEGEIKNAKQ